MILQSPHSQARASKFGIRGYQIATTDTEPKSYIALAGFYKPNPDNMYDPQIVALQIDNKFLASTAMSQAQTWSEEKYICPNNIPNHNLYHLG